MCALITYLKNKVGLVMKNAIIWEMDNFTTKGAFEQLEIAENIKISAWFRTKDEFKKSNFESYPKQYFWQDLVKEEFAREDFNYCPEEIYNKIYKELFCDPTGTRTQTVLSDS